MSVSRHQFAGTLALGVLTLLITGCASGPRFGQTSCEVGCVDGCCPECGDSCTDGCCECGYCCEEPRRWSREWYAMKACDPVGARQCCRFGKMWPPYPRPQGPPQQFSHVYHAAHYWPLPYICQDRAYVKQVLDTQVANGWAQETTLYEYHFEPGTNLLTHAGFQHLRWILQEAPPERRCVFVQAGLDEIVSQGRMENVRVAACQLVGEDQCPALVLRVAQPTGTPAEYVDSIQRAIRDSLPEPRIQYQSLPSGTGGG